MTQERGKLQPVIEQEAKPFWEFCTHHELRVQKCTQCGELRYPINDICPDCSSNKSEWVKLNGKGRVYSFIIVHRSRMPSFAGEAPYTVAIIETEEGIRMLSNVVGCIPEAVHVGMPVEVVFKDVSPEFSLPQFTPVG